MIKWIISIFVLIGYSSAFAHSPDISSTVLMEQDNGDWILQIRAPLTGLEYEINHNYGKESFATAEEFQELVLQYMKGQISIEVNGEKVALDKGIIKLGHESAVIYQLTDMPKTINDMVVINSAFRDISRNQVQLMVLKKGVDRNQFVLNNANDHQVALQVMDNKITQKEQVLAGANNPKWYFMSLALLTLGMVTYLKLKAA